MTIAPMRWAMRTKPLRVQFTPTPRRTSREPGTSTPAAMAKAALDGSPGTTSSSSVSSSVPATVTWRPLRCTVTPAAVSMRSVWSRLAAGSVTVVAPSAARPASSTHDFTCALATGSS